MVFYGGKQRGYAQEQLQENWRLQNAVIFVLIGAITQGNEQILDFSRRSYIFKVLKGIDHDSETLIWEISA